jgi:ribosome maturation factor RimP
VCPLPAPRSRPSDPEEVAPAEGPSAKPSANEPDRPTISMTLSFDKNALIDVIEPVCKAHGLELVDVSMASEHGAVLRVLLDREGGAHVEKATGRLIPGSGVSLADCQAVSRDLSTVLDVHERLLPSGRYRLEVSSPGVDRPLVRPRDFERFAGVEIRVHTKLPLDEGGRRKVQGILEKLESGAIHVKDEPSRTTWVVPLDNVSKANVVFRFQ